MKAHLAHQPNGEVMVYIDKLTRGHKWKTESYATREAERATKALAKSGAWANRGLVTVDGYPLDKAFYTFLFANLPF